LRIVRRGLLLVVVSAVLPLAGCDRAATAEAAERPGALDFVDVARERGLDVVNVSGDPRRWYIVESNGCGAAWLDYDGDGDLDLFVANGSGLRYLDDGARLEVLHDASSRLYRNDDGGRRFTDVTAATGAGRSEWINAVATGDVDNDGDTDLYLACFGPDVLLVNEGGRFVDATARAGLGCGLWGAGAAFGDADGDGDLDLYVANYCLFDPAHPPDGGKRESIEGVEVGWGPEGENHQGFNPGAPDVFYRNDGRGRFTDATVEAGLELEKPLCSYAAVFSDVDGDGDQDLLVANDLQPCNLFVNLGGGRFEERGVESGFAFDAAGKATGAMGLAVADVDGDGDQDVYRTNFDFETNGLYVNDGHGRFSEQAARCGLAAPSEDRLGWGCAFFDADLDGDLDLVVANGHVYPQAERVGMHAWLQLSQLFEAVPGPDGAPAWRDATAEAGEAFRQRRSARGLALADFDDDGDLDVLLVDVGEPPRLLENRSRRAGRWIAVKTVGTASNRDGYGAVVTVTAGGRDRVREVRTNDGLYSAHDPRVHFGLGPVERVERVTVRWPSGRASVVEHPPLDRVLVVREPQEASR
jgi:enediyne biosynthesis protein E4